MPTLNPICGKIEISESEAKNIKFLTKPWARPTPGNNQWYKKTETTSKCNISSQKYEPQPNSFLSLVNQK